MLKLYIFKNKMRNILIINDNIFCFTKERKMERARSISIFVKPISTVIPESRGIRI